MQRFYSWGFFYDKVSNSVLLHLRDENTSYNPNCWAFFGGLSEWYETPLQCFKREIREELGIDLDDSEINYLCDYFNEEFKVHRYVFFVEKNVSIEEINLMEGKSIKRIKLEDVFNYNLTDKTRKDLLYFLDRKK